VVVVSSLATIPSPATAAAGSGGTARDREARIGGSLLSRSSPVATGDDRREPSRSDSGDGTGSTPVTGSKPGAISGTIVGTIISAIPPVAMVSGCRPCRHRKLATPNRTKNPETDQTELQVITAALVVGGPHTVGLLQHRSPIGGQQGLRGQSDQAGIFTDITGDEY